ncbi:unnamed protein product [Linum trigynum]|uniref:Uncharacterized protein n=1 Tax=Linum trigynum TaxID=586398 RepID=A0AAV2EQ23_9ROSI
MVTVTVVQPAVDQSNVLMGDSRRSTTSEVEPEPKATANRGPRRDRLPPARSPIMSPVKRPVVESSTAVKTSAEEEFRWEAECGRGTSGRVVAGHGWGRLASDNYDDGSAAVLGQGSRGAGQTIGPPNVVREQELRPASVWNRRRIRVGLGQRMGGLTRASLFRAGPRKQEDREVAVVSSEVRRQSAASGTIIKCERKEYCWEREVKKQFVNYRKEKGIGTGGLQGWPVDKRLVGMAFFHAYVRIKGGGLRGKWLGENGQWWTFHPMHGKVEEADVFGDRSVIRIIERNWKY